MKKTLFIGLVFLFTLNLFAQTLTSSNLPLIVINTNGQTIADDPKIMADMGIIYNGTGVRNNITDPFNHYNGKIGIEIRGQSSQMFPMKSYGIELWDNAGNSQDKSLFGLPKESDWVLYAPYNDKTLMHNFLAYTMAREMGRWAANCRYVEVLINGDYKGIYILMEKIKRNSGRVNISKINTTDITGDAVTGGYIFSIDKDADAWYSSYLPPFGTTGQSIRYSYVYPKITAIVPEQRSWLKSYVDSFESAFNSLQYQDKQNGWRRYADEQSFIDYFIINEVSRNVDGYRLSTYLYKDRKSKGGKIIAGPVWDYDLAFHNANYCSGSDSVGWSYQFNKTCPQDFWQVPFWWYKLEDDSAFQSNLRCRWKQLRQTRLSDNRLNTLIDSVVNLTAEARQRHFQRWPVLGMYIWPNPQPIPATYDGEILVLKEWLMKRITWINSTIPNKGACYDYPASVKESVIVSIYPNPVESQLTLNIKSRFSQQLKINVIDGMGRSMTLATYSLHYGENFFQLTTERWASGIYFVTYQSGNGEKASLKLLKK
jgi:CotH kinase protein/Secretion system C-terminal sorting domain